MAVVRKLLKGIDTLSEFSGSIGKWFALALVFIGTFETISRHLFGAPTIWSYDSLSMAGGALYMLGASYDYLHNAHTRVDLIYSRLKPRAQASINAVASLILFFPLVTVMLWFSAKWAIKAWKINEVMFTSFWYPPAGPYRTLVTLGFFLLLLQGLAQLVRDIYFIVRGAAIDEH